MMFSHKLNSLPHLKMSEKIIPRGLHLLHDPALNKGTAFTVAERDALGLRGLLPPHVQTQAEQVERVIGSLGRKASDLERYIFLIALADRNRTLFYRIITDHIEQMMPIIYTPTVGLACQQYGKIFRRPGGLFISMEDRGRVADLLRNWPERNVRVIVVTDGERILGLGDLGANGMGIPIGKLMLYTACAGVYPSQCLPVTIDVGTNNTALLADPLYLGSRERRLRGPEYDSLIDEFVEAATKLFPRLLIQFEDFGNQNAFRLLERYRERICTFNDDIQGTAAVALAGLYGALRITGESLRDQRVLFFGAGEAGIGIASLLVSALMEAGLSESEARPRCWFVDSKGLVVRSRNDLSTHKLVFAQDHAFLSEPVAIIESVRPTVLIGVSGNPGVFSRSVLEAAARQVARPIVFAMSNPTSLVECTAEEAYRWTEGRAIFASGSPFDAVSLGSRRFVPGQGNNAYIFPGVGLGVIACASRLVTDEMFLAAARTLAGQVSQAELDEGRVYPRLTRIREVSRAVAAAVIRVACEKGLAGVAVPDELDEFVQSLMYEPEYHNYV
jgi:malate dehydrogenase (oxaloacetate-decarboxylating)(NADP+)